MYRYKRYTTFSCIVFRTLVHTLLQAAQNWTYCNLLCISLMAQKDSQQFHMSTARKYARDCTHENPMRLHAAIACWGLRHTNTLPFAAGLSNGRMVIHMYILAIAFMLIISRSTSAPLVEMQRKLKYRVYSNRCGLRQSMNRP